MAASFTKYLELTGGDLRVAGVTLLSDVPSNVYFKRFWAPMEKTDAPYSLVSFVQCVSHKAGLLGFKSETESETHVNSIGKFTERDFLSVFRFKTWWSTQWVGRSGSDLRKETQWVMLHIPESQFYVLIIPIIEGKFRSSLEPGRAGQVRIRVESGSTRVTASSFDGIAYLHVSDNPYNVMKEAYSALRVYMNTFRLRVEKPQPRILDKFGWCSWDSFYLTVDPVGIWSGLNDFYKSGLEVRFVIIDDGWQSINADDDDPTVDKKRLILGGTQMTSRIYRIQECDKFGKYKLGTITGTEAPSYDAMRGQKLIKKAVEIEHAEKARARGLSESESESRIRTLKQELDQLFGEDAGEEPSSGGDGLMGFTADLRKCFKGLDDIYVWHALCGAWGGVRPGSIGLRTDIVPAKPSSGLDETMEDLAVVKIVEAGIGLVHPTEIKEFYDMMHAYLAKCGITGVKVDVMHTLEYVAEEYGGRVELAKAYYSGLTDSLRKNFKGSRLLASMQHCNDFFFLGTRQISFARVGDDFWFQDPNGDPMGVYWLQGVHMVHCAYNSLWMGQFVHPDWDMFQSDHCCAEFHAGSRAISGGPVYLSDSVGGHDFDLIKKLVYPDGTIPKCSQYALPTRDCLFKNPLFDHKTLLKIWNFNSFSGVVGVFNCQGAGWDPNENRIRGFPECYKPVSGSVHITNVEWDQLQNENRAAISMFDHYVVYLTKSKKLLLTSRSSDPIAVTIQPSDFEIFSFVPVMTLECGVECAPIGLANMFNCNGTVLLVEYGMGSLSVRVKGSGSFLAYASEKPVECCLNGVVVDFEWSHNSQVTVEVPWVHQAAGVSEVLVAF